MRRASILELCKSSCKQCGIFVICCASCMSVHVQSHKVINTRHGHSSHLDIVEGKVNKGIYLKEEKGVTLLYHGRYKTSCISNPAQCGPEGESQPFGSFSGSHCRVACAPLGSGRRDCGLLVSCQIRENHHVWVGGQGRRDAGTQDSHKRPVLETKTSSYRNVRSKYLIS